MLKELENKIVINDVEYFLEPEVSVKEYHSDKYGDILVQNHIPTSEYNVIVQACIEEMPDEKILTGDYECVLARYMLEEYTNISVANIEDEIVYDIYGEIVYGVWEKNFVNSNYKTYYDIERIFYRVWENKKMEIIVKKVMENFFSDQVTRNALEQVQEDLESLDMEKIADLFKLFGVSNGIK